MSRQYLNAAKVIDGVVFEKKCFKSVCAGMKIGKTEYALAAETLKYKHILDDLFQRCNVSADELSVRYSVLLVMTYELLFGQKKISSGGAVKRKLKEIETNLKTQLDLLLLEKQQENNLQTDSTISPTSNSNINNLLNPIKAMKYVRVNQIKMKLKDALISIQELCKEAHFDHHIPTVICLPNHQKGLGENELVKSGQLIIQDKSSCFPSQILGECWWRGQVQKTVSSEESRKNVDHSNSHVSASSASRSSTSSGDDNTTLSNYINGTIIQGGDDIIDACSAPGNKTSHLANFIHTYFCSGNNNNSSNCDSSSQEQPDNNSTTTNNINNNNTNSTTALIPQIFAFEKSPDRFKLLSHRTIKQAGAGHIIQPTLMDFLTVDPLDPRYSKVRYCLMDPSCSGSGLSSIERLVERRGAVTAAATVKVQQEKKNAKNGLKNNSKVNGNTSKTATTKVQDDEKQRNYDRLLKLQAFQITMLLHSFRFPNIEYVVYSTCSIYQEENEQVVAQVLQRQREAEEVTDFEPIEVVTSGENNDTTNNKNVHGSFSGANNDTSNSSSSNHRNDDHSNYIWDVVTPTGMSVSEWSRRGEPCAGLTLTQSQALIRCAPEDMTSGFFVALFRKIKIPSAVATSVKVPSSSVAAVKVASSSIADAGAAGSKANEKSNNSNTNINISSDTFASEISDSNKKRKLSRHPNSVDHEDNVDNKFTSGNSSLIKDIHADDGRHDNYRIDDDDESGSRSSNNKKARMFNSSSPFMTYWKPYAYRY